MQEDARQSLISPKLAPIRALTVRCYSDDLGAKRRNTYYPDAARKRNPIRLLAGTARPTRDQNGNSPFTTHDPIIYFDESGNSGSNLLDASQPVFVLAAVSMPDDRAEELVSPLRNLHSRELKFKHVRQTEIRRRTFVRTIATRQLSTDDVKVLIIHKRHMISGKFVDILMEPECRRTGVNLYANGFNVRAAETLTRLGPVYCGESTWQALERAFVKLARSDTGEPFGDYLDALNSARKSASQSDSRLSRILNAFSTNQALILEELETGNPERLPPLDPALTSLNVLLLQWSEILPSFSVVHDASSSVSKHRDVLITMHNSEASKTNIDFGADRQFQIPGNATSVDFADSADVVQLQLADTIAGAIAHWLNHRDTRDEFADQLDAAGISRLISWGIWPHPP